MAEFDFERRLDKLFGEPLAFADSTGFAGRVQSRLNRRGAVRRLVIGALGGAGGLFGVVQLVGSGVLTRIGDLDQAPARETLQGLRGAIHAWVAAHLDGMITPGSGVMWMTVAAVGLAIAWAVSHLIEDL